MDVIVLYDGFCPLCRVLASLLSHDVPAGWQILAFQEYRLPPPEAQNWLPNELQILHEGQLLAGVPAWDFLIQHAPQMKVYQKLAVRIGLSPPRQARWLRFLGHGLRMLCPVCPSSSSPSHRRRSSLSAD
jgi:hypothetical protein